MTKLADLPVLREIWIAFDVGCIECGESSSVIGAFLSSAEADLAIAAWRKAGGEWQGGQHHGGVFRVEIPS